MEEAELPPCPVPLSPCPAVPCVLSAGGCCPLVLGVPRSHLEMFFKRQLKEPSPSSIMVTVVSRWWDGAAEGPAQRSLDLAPKRTKHDGFCCFYPHGSGEMRRFHLQPNPQHPYVKYQEASEAPMSACRPHHLLSNPKAGFCPQMRQKSPGWTSQCQIMIQPDPIVQKPTFSAAQPHTQVLVKPGLSDLLNISALGS